MRPLHTLAVGSFAVHGSASLKTFISTLGERVLPVPSVLLDGLTNLPNVHRFSVPFYELLSGTFELAVHRKLDLLLYVGYLGDSTQAESVLELSERYRDLIKTIIVDPVCGDNGRTYVAPDVISQWPVIMARADLAFPNITELKILSGLAIDAGVNFSDAAKAFAARFPKPRLIVTSVEASPGETGIQVFGDEGFGYSCPLLPKNFGGTGDALVSLFIRNHFYHGIRFDNALRQATDQTYGLIKKSIERGTNDLILDTN